MDLDAALTFPNCRFTLALWCDDTVEQIAEFATRAMRVAVNQVNNDLESDVENLVNPPNSFGPAAPVDPSGWTTRSLELRGDLDGDHIWTLAVAVAAPASVDEAKLQEKLGYFQMFVQQRLESQADGLHLWKSPALRR
jgi:hypothetical protein